MNKIFPYILSAIGAAIIATLAQITIPIGPIPFSLQNIGIGLIATLFHRREAVLATTLYLLLGAIGLPVFAGATSGFSVLIGPTAGYLWFYLVYALMTSSLTSANSSSIRIFFANLLGDTFVFLGGTLGLLFLAKLPLQQALLVGVFPFLLPDFIKIILISLLSRLILTHVKQFSYFTKK